MQTQQQTLKFANIGILASRVFYQRTHVYAMVVHNPILKGHIMLCPMKGDQRYKELSNSQLFEISLAIKELSEIIQIAFGELTAEGTGDGGATGSQAKISTTVVMQEFDRGQKTGNTDTNVNHLRVHILPRSTTDKFQGNEEGLRRELENFMSLYMPALKN